MKFTRICTTAALIAALLPAPAQADDWPQWRGPNRNGRSAETNWLKNWPPVAVWTQQVGQGYSAAAISEGRLYTVGFNSATTQDTVYCFNATNGTQVWHYSYSSAISGTGYEGPRASPTVDGANVYTYNHQGRFYCFNKYTGATNWYKMVWSTNGGWGMCGSPLVDGNTIYFNAQGAGQAVSKTGTHSTVWWNAGTCRYTSPLKVIWNAQTSILVAAETGVYGLNPLNGKTNWWYSWLMPNSSADPIIYGDKIFLTSADRGGCTLLQLKSGELSALYTTNTLRSECATPVLVGDYLYGFNYGTLVCMDIRTGVEQWSQPDCLAGEGTIVAADGRLIMLGRYDGNLRVVKASPSGYDTEGLSPFTVVSNAQDQLWYTAPTLANGMIYCRNSIGTLVALRIGGAPADVNSNGVPDLWEQSRLGGATNSLPGTDTDGDRFPDKSEYVAGTDPTNAGSRLLLQFAPAGSGFTVSWPTKAVSGLGYDPAQSRRYRLEMRTNLLSGSWQPVPGYTNIVGNDLAIAYTNAAPGPGTFYRANVRLQ